VKRLLHKALGARGPAASAESANPANIAESAAPAESSPPAEPATKAQSAELLLRARPDPEPPPGGLVIQVSTKVLGGYEDSENPRAQRFAESLGRDHLWVRQDEKEMLTRGELPESLIRRLVRYHLVDNTRGEPPYWRPEEIRESSWSLEKGVLSGRVHLETARGDRGYRAEARGHVAVLGGEVTRFDLVVSGSFRGHGRFTRGAPEGEFPFAVAFRIIQASCEADRTPPGGARGNLKRYLD
jgi:hypothetical protein